MAGTPLVQKCPCRNKFRLSEFVEQFCISMVMKNKRKKPRLITAQNIGLHIVRHEHAHPDCSCSSRLLGIHQPHVIDCVQKYFCSSSVFIRKMQESIRQITRFLGKTKVSLLIFYSAHKNTYSLGKQMYFDHIFSFL